MGKRVPDHQADFQPTRGVVIVNKRVANRVGFRWAAWPLVMLGLLLAASIQAKEVETTAVGLGADENAALADALAKAVAQVNGVRSAMDVSTGKLEVTGKASATSAQGTVETQSKVQVGTTADARLSAQGKVSRYEVINTDFETDGRVRLTVKAFVSVYEAPVYNAPGSKTSRQRIAVFPAQALRDSYDFFGYVDSSELASQLAARLETSIMDTGRVSLLDRRSLGASLVELGLVGSSLTNAQEKAKLKQIRGADLVVLATVQDARYLVETYQVKSTGQIKSNTDLFLEIDLRAVVPATGELLLSKRVSVRDAYDRDDALSQVADLAAYEVVRTLTGSAPPPPDRRAAVQQEEPVPDTPRRSGVLLPTDR